jgi:ubiquinone/menaquinone biosynthesis C-methylase UbiE
VEFLVTNGLDLPFPDGAFRLVILWSQTFGLFYTEENRRRILAEARRVLVPAAF